MDTSVGRVCRSVRAYRFALYNLVLKDFRIRYRNMSLGILWSLLNPLVMLGVLVFIFSYVYPNPEVPFFPVFILLGLIIFNFFQLCLSATTNSIVENATLLKKTSFPRIILPLSVVLSQTIHLLIQLLLLSLFVLLFRVPITWHALVWLPAAFAILFIFTVGMCLICATLNVYFRDVLYLVQSALTVLFWFTPIFYSLSLVHDRVPTWMYGAYILNPMAGCIDAARMGLLYHGHPDTVAFSVAVAVALGALGAGLELFDRREKFFTEKL